MYTSGFYNDDFKIEELELLGDSTATSITYKLRKDGRLYFMKQLRSEYTALPRYRAMFFKEFECGKAVRHPNVVEYLSISENENGLCIIMEYVNGMTLKEKLASEPEYFRNEENVYKFLTQLLDGLSALHILNILYLDFSPANIMFTNAGNDVRLIDLGCCVSDINDNTGGCTEGFYAPEIDEKDISLLDARTDIYGIGCLLRYIKERSGAKFSRYMNGIMERCLCNNKAERFQTASDAIKVVRHRNRKRNISIGVATALVFAVLFMLWRIEGSITAADEQAFVDTVYYYDLEYRILSRQNMTCEVIGAKDGRENIYVEGTVMIGSDWYKVVQIKDSAFWGKPIKSFYLPEGIERIGFDAFSCCDSVVTVSLPSSLKEFPAAFSRMTSVRKIKISPMPKISGAAFAWCTSLDDVDIPEGVERICFDAFGKCYALKEVCLPQTLKVIERGVFYECRSLEEITIPAQVEEIGDYAFYGCTALRDVYVHAVIPPKITMIFNTPDITVHVPAEALDAYEGDFNWREYRLVGDL